MAPAPLLVVENEYGGGAARAGDPGAVGETDLVVLGRLWPGHDALPGGVTSEARRDAARATTGAGARGRAERPCAEWVLSPHGPRPPVAVGELEAHLLPLRARGVHGPAEAHTVGHGVNALTAQQAVDRRGGELGRGRTHGSHVRCQQVGGVSLARVVVRPAVAALSDQDPAATIGGHVAVVLRGLRHGRRQEPVVAVRGARPDLLDLPAGARRRVGEHCRSARDRSPPRQDFPRDRARTKPRARRARWRTRTIWNAASQSPPGLHPWAPSWRLRT